MEIFKSESGRRTWHLRWIDHRGIERRTSSKTRDKSTANIIGRNIEILQDYRIKSAAPPEDLTHWLANICPPAVVERLKEFGIVEQTTIDQGRKLWEDPADEPPAAADATRAPCMILRWRQAIADRERGDRYADMSVRRLITLFAVAGIEHLNDIKPEKVNDAILQLRKGSVSQELLDAIHPTLRDQDKRQIRRGLSPRTLNHYLDKAQQFCLWAKVSALSGMTGYDGNVLETNRRYVRRVLSPEEQRYLLEYLLTATAVQFDLSAADRHLVYLVPLYSGLRPKEMTKITRAAFVLGDDPTITITAIVGKAKRVDVLPLHPCLIEPLKKHLEHKLPLAPAFSLPHPNSLVTMLRADVAAARAKWIQDAAKDPKELQKRTASEFLLDKNSAGAVLDFYTLRHTYGTNLAREGVPFKLHMELMRHRDVKTTMQYYVHLELNDRRAALQKLSSPPPPPATAATA